MRSTLIWQAKYLLVLLFLSTSIFTFAQNSIILTQTSTFVGQFLTFEYDASLTTSTSWFAIALPDDPLDTYFDWDYSDQDKQQMTLRLPSAPGGYEVRLLDKKRQGDIVLIAKSNLIEAQEITATLEAPTNVITNESFSVLWQGPALQGDMVVLTELSSGADLFMQGQSLDLNQHVVFKAPEKAGYYELRYLSGNPYRVIASIALDVLPDPAEVRTTEAANCTENPTEASLNQAFDTELSSFLAQAQLTYAGTYSNLSYTYNSSPTINNTLGQVEATYNASLTEVESGEIINSTGSISTTFEWLNCSWQLIDYRY